METLRKGVLASFKTMRAFCLGDGYDSRFMTDWAEQFGFRVDHAGYSFFVRLCPKMGDYHVWVHCYRQDWLDQHMKNAERGIRFIDSKYNELFRIEDGGRIAITREDGQKTPATCRYIDDYHVEVGYDHIYHICELAESCERNGRKVEAVTGLMEKTKC